MLDPREAEKTKGFNKTLTVTRKDERTIRKSEAAEAFWRIARPEQNLSWVSTCCSEQFKLFHESTNIAITRSIWTATCRLFFHAQLLQNMEIWLSGYVSQLRRTNRLTKTVQNLNQETHSQETQTDTHSPIESKDQVAFTCTVGWFHDILSSQLYISGP